MDSSLDAPQRGPTVVFLSALAVVAASTAFLSGVSGYGTVLYQLLALTAWSLLATVTSSEFADQHHAAVWAVAVLTNLFAFSLVAAPVYFAMRHRAPRACGVTLFLWLALYVCSLFVLFPASDGP